MSTIPSMLACGNMHISTGDMLVLLLMAGCWIAAGTLCLVNLILILFARRSLEFKCVNILIFLTYLGLATFLFCLPQTMPNTNQLKLNGNLGLTLVIAIPFLVMSHFVYLLVCLRRSKPSKMDDL